MYYPVVAEIDCFLLIDCCSLCIAFLSRVSSLLPKLRVLSENSTTESAGSYKNWTPWPHKAPWRTTKNIYLQPQKKNNRTRQVECFSNRWDFCERFQMSLISVEGSLWQHRKCANSGKLWFTVMFKVLPKALGVDIDFHVLFLLLLLFLVFLMMKNEFPAVLWVAHKLAVISFYCVTAKPGLWLCPLRPQMTGHCVALQPAAKDSIFKTFIWLNLFCCCSFQKTTREWN